jgi:VHL beta domain
VARPQAEEGIVGVHLDLEHDDPLWQALLEKDHIDYLVPGYRASALDLTRGRDKIKAFRDACRAYAQAILGDAKADAGAPPSSGGSADEKEAFDSAKELGTVAAWEAFLSNYASGFHADLARAYIKKLKGASGAPPPPPSSAQALGPVLSSIARAPAPETLAEKPYPAQRSCSERANLRSERSDTPAKINFVHYSGPRRDVYWLDYAGHGQNMITIKPGQQTTADTFLTHPWMITDADGNCIEIVLPRPVPSVVRFGTPSEPEKASSSKSCRRGYLRIDGKCIRKRDAATYCGPGYRLQGTKCVQGYKQPPPLAQRPSWQIEAIKKGCKPGMAWSAQEGCHEND